MPAKSPIGDALYNWFRENHEVGTVLTQNELLDSGIIPQKSLVFLLEAVKYLTSKRLLKLHDIKGSQAAGYELVEEAAAANYGGLTSDEQMVYGSIESAGTAGLWTKTIKAKSGVHANVLDKVYKSLESKGLIKPMKSVKHPQRKMYIRAGLTPSEEATGGTWFNDGRLDIGMIEAVSDAIEVWCSQQSWKEADDESDSEMLGIKRKQPTNGFDESGTAKQKKLANGKASNEGKPKELVFEPIAPRYQGYPTLAAISQQLTDNPITQLPIPNNALQQLVDVMVYDGRLHRIWRVARSDETPDVPDRNQIAMYRCFKSPLDLGRQRARKAKIQAHHPTHMRAQEIEDIGRGGHSEVPCMDCPVFEICGDGGPINVRTCVYLPDWKIQLETADMEADDPWPQLQRTRKTQPRR